MKMAESKSKNKILTIEEIANKVNKDLKRELLVEGIRDQVIKRIPFSSPRMNYQTYGGVPRGRMIEFSGPESSGKTTTALDIIGNFQKLAKLEYDTEVSELESKLQEPKLKATDKKELSARLDELKYLGRQRVVYIDQEGTLDSEWASINGVDVDDLWLFPLQEHTAEQILDIAIDTIKSGQCGLLIIDSIAMLIPQQVADESLETKSYAGNAKPVTDFVNRAIPLLGKNNCTCIVINQVKDKIGGYSGGLSTPCGHALKHQCSLRLSFRQGPPVNELGIEQKVSCDSPQGNIVQSYLIKSKTCKPDRRTSFYTLNYDRGVDVLPDTVNMAIQYGIIKGSGWYTFVNPNTGEVICDEEGDPFKIQGIANVYDYLKEEPEFFNKISSWVDSIMYAKKSNDHEDDAIPDDIAKEIKDENNESLVDSGDNNEY